MGFGLPLKLAAKPVSSVRFAGVAIACGLELPRSQGIEPLTPQKRIRIPLESPAGAALEKYFNPVIRLMRALPKPIVSAVNGVAAGVGMSFVLASDIAIAAKSASFLQAFARIGLLPDGGSTWFLPRLVGEQRARALAMLAPQIPAEQAKEWGLIWDVVEDGELMKTATELARRLADGPTMSLARIKEAMNRASGNDLGRQLDTERDFQRELGRSEDFKEGVAAFLAKRKPSFKGK